MGFGLNIADDAGKPLRCRVTIIPGFGVGPCEHEFRPGLPLPVAIRSKYLARSAKD